MVIALPLFQRLMLCCQMAPSKATWTFSCGRHHDEAALEGFINAAEQNQGKFTLLIFNPLPLHRVSNKQIRFLLKQQRIDVIIDIPNSSFYLVSFQQLLKAQSFGRQISLRGREGQTFQSQCLSKGPNISAVRIS